LLSWTAGSKVILIKHRNDNSRRKIAAGYSPL
jgi:hypothetical protein